VIMMMVVDVAMSIVEATTACF